MPDLPDLRARSAIALGATACVILLTGLIGWAASAAIVSAVVAMGEVDVEELKWVILMVLFNQPDQEAAYSWLENLMFDHDESVN